MYSIYKLQSTSTDRVYIGCTSTSLHRRFIHHLSSFNSSTPKKNSVYSYVQIRNAGLNITDFTISLIVEIEDNKEAFKTEKLYIAQYADSVGVFNNTEFENHWCKGTKGIAKANEGSFKKGSTVGEETRFKKGSTVGKSTRFKKGETNNTAGTVTVHKDNKNHRISPDKLEEYLSNGFKKGMKPRVNAKGYNERNGRFQAYLTIDGKLKMLGTYDTKEEAQEVRRKAML